jgi:flagellar motor switch protein FliG
MENKNNNVLAMLEQLYVSLQLLNRKLVTARASGIMQAVVEINDLLPNAASFNIGHLSEEDARKAREIVRRIQVLQELNRSVCNGGLRIISELAGQSLHTTAYNENGKLNEAILEDVNLSA